MKFEFFLVSEAPAITDRDLRRCSEALSLSLAECAADWAKETPSVNVSDKVTEVPDRGVIVLFSDTIEDKRDLALHKVGDDGRPTCVVLAVPGWECGADHECKETLIDPFCDQFVPWIGGEPGDLIALEVCDPVQNITRPFDVSEGAGPVLMSDHVNPPWFDGHAWATQWDRSRACERAGQIPPGAGYAIVVKKAGDVVHLGKKPPAWKAGPAWRYGKRLVAAHQRAMRIRLA